MNRETKTFTAEIKAVGDETGADAGTFTALVSVFGNVDLGGDKMLPGAFADTLAAWQAKGDPIPVIWSHQWDNPEAHIGIIDPKDATETAAGLEVKGRLDVERPFAAQVHHLMKNRRVTQFSFGYFTKDASMVDDPEYGAVREIAAVDLFEVGPTLVGMNQATQLLEAASALTDIKAGRVLSSKNEDRIRQAVTYLNDVLASLADEGKSLTPEADEEPVAPATEPEESSVDAERVLELLTRPRSSENPQ